MGSNPSVGSSFFKNGSVPEWSKGADCKSAGSAFGGSNPPRPTSMKDSLKRVFLIICDWFGVRADEKFIPGLEL